MMGTRSCQINNKFGVVLNFELPKPEDGQNFVGQRGYVNISGGGLIEG